MLYERDAAGTVDDVTRRIEAATAENGFGVMTILDLKARMAAKGVELGPECRIVEVCNPRDAKRVLESNMAISTALPCRISVYQAGEQVRVSTLKPTEVLGMFGSPELRPVAEGVEATMIRIIDQACAAG
jgi:uncharacterized protein (DUF302 family)